MLLVTIGGLAAGFIANLIAAYVIIGMQEHMDVEAFRRLRWGLSPVFFAGFAAFFVVANIMFSRRMTKKINKPLDILNGGVRQIRESNFACRIEYGDDDEFRAVCDAFNHMAAQLEASAERRLKDEVSRRELLAGISHDLRNPLTTINGYLDGLESGVASTPEMREKYFAAIKSNARGMKHIIEQLFLFSKLDMDDFPFHPRRFDIMRALSDMVEEVADDYLMKGLAVSIAGGPENMFVCADSAQLRRVLVNILENGAKYKEKETGRMEISAALDGGFARLRFADDGPGVSLEALPNLFGAFYRADPSRHTKGSGLGLAISAKIIERSGGAIHAEPSDSGGLAVVVSLPIDAGSPGGGERVYPAGEA
ncbi:MAG: HAMP domain-containing histidine kinase [Treponema sp.]|nr:HAMP domain-containing histidine kinase [Treponema sp.]